MAEETVTETAPEETTPESLLQDLQDQVDGLKLKLTVGLVLILGLAVLLAQRVYLEKSSVHTNALVFADQGTARSAVVLSPNGHLAHVAYRINGTLPSLDSTKAPGLKGMAFYDSEGRPRIVVGLNQDEEPVLGMLSPDGHLVWSALPTESAPPAEADKPVEKPETPNP